jgi:hypothetical protein
LHANSSGHRCTSSNGSSQEDDVGFVFEEGQAKEVLHLDIINTLTAAQTVGRPKHELKRYLKPIILAVDELGCLPIDKTGADPVFQEGDCNLRSQENG